MQGNKKKFLAAAIAAMVGMPLAAYAQSSVTIYGKLYPQINHFDLSGASGVGTATSTLTGPISGTAAAVAARADSTGTLMESSNSRIGFRGVEGLGGNTTAIFQLEATVGVDNGAGGTNGIMWNRDTFVGLAGNFGTIRLGNMDTVYKNLGDTLSFLGISSGNFISTSNILSKPGIGSSSASSFHLRRNNSVVYESPEFAGFQALFDYSLGEVVDNFRSGAVISTGVKYEQGPIYAALAYERHNDLYGASKNIVANISNLSATGAVLPGVTSTDTGTRATLQYKVTPQIRVEGNVARLTYKEDGGAVGKFREYKTTTWALAADYKMQAFNFAGSYGQGNAGSCSLVGGGACSTQNLDGKMVNLGVGYSLSKRTMLYLIGSKMFNAGSARWSNVGDAPKPLAGQDITQVALGVRHDF